MNYLDLLKLIICIIISASAGIIGSFFTLSSIPGWYATLEKPALSPPNWIFGPVWTALYLLMGIAAFLIWKKGLEKKEVKIALSVFILQLILNTLWSIIFFGLHNPGLALIGIMLLWAAIVWAIVVFYKISRPAAYFLVPYILWVTFAAYLNGAIWVLNSASQVDDISSARCTQDNAAYLDPSASVSQRVDDLLGRMTEWEKIGQMALIEKNSIHDLGEISKYNLGALLSGGGAGPKQETPAAWLGMVNSFQAATKNTCLKIPLLYGIDAIHGHANVLGATVFPHAIGLGASHDVGLVKRVAVATAKEMAVTGIYWSFSPNLDVAQDIRWGKTYETLGSDTANVAKLGTAYLAGLQESAKPYVNVLATAKHFIGGGSMEYGTARNKDFKVEEGNITLSEKQLRQIHLIPFQKALASGAQVVMVGTATWNGNMNTSNKYLLTDVLKKELGFSGFVVSDWYGVYQVAHARYESLVNSVNAGVDMVMTPFEYKDFMSNMQKALANGDISKQRLDDAARRILTAKFKAGLFDRPAATQEGLSVIGNSEHRLLAREAVRKSQVLLKNENFVLPLSKSEDKIIIAGLAADNLGRQAGGWTTEWQGIDGNYGITGTTVLEAMKNTVSKNTKVEYNLRGDFSEGSSLADVGIVVVGEKPYAEGWGDNANPSLSAEDLETIQKVKLKSKKIIVVIISGRPLDIKQYVHEWDGVVASWLPGSEAEGITDVLFGDYPFTGRLPIGWSL